MGKIRVATSLFVFLITAVAHLAEAQEPQQAPPDRRFWHRDQLTGDWGGVRTDWKKKGFELALTTTHFYQGIVSGGVEENSEYTGEADLELKFDLGKLIGLNQWLMDFKVESRFGGPLLSGTGAVNPVNTAALIPADAGDEISVTTLNFTGLFPVNAKEGNFFAVSIGRFNFIDALQEDFFAGAGVERFFNIAQVGPLTVVREVPLISYAANLIYIRKGEPFFTFALIDPNDYSLVSGLSDLFGDGVTFSPALHLPSKFFGKSGKHTFMFAITTKEYTPFDAIRQIIIPGPAQEPIEPESGSWSASYTLRQYIVERGRKDSWGLFGQLAVANKSTSPIAFFFDVGLGGNGLFSSRRHDEWGIAYAYTDLSSTLKDNLALPPLNLELRAEQQGELFYNLHIAPWLQLTGDLQILRAVRPTVETAIVPGGRLRVIF